MALVLKHSGRSLSRTRQERVYRETWQGIEDQIDNKALLLSIGDYDANKGYITSIDKQQGDGRFWDLVVQYTLTYDNKDGNAAATVVGQKSAALSTRNIQMPLEKASGYLTQWNYYLIGLGEYATEIPSWWMQSASPIVPESDRKNYMWIKSLSEIPLDPDENGNYWNVVQESNFACTPAKPGQQYYDLEYFVVTEKAKYATASAAGNAVNKNINKIVSPSNTFGITGGNWKLDNSSVSWDGQTWVCENVYTHSPTGWDTDLYQTASSGGSNINNPIGG